MLNQILPRPLRQQTANQASSGSAKLSVKSASDLSAREWRVLAAQIREMRSRAVQSSAAPVSLCALQRVPVSEGIVSPARQSPAPLGDSAEPYPEDVSSEGQRQRLPRVSASRPRPAGVAFLPQQEADRIVQAWMDEAARQGREPGLGNHERTVLSLFDASGVMSAPWEEAGYHVIRYDLQDGVDINDFDAELLLERHGGDNVWAIIAQPPCTDFALSGARWWAEKDARGVTELSNELVRQSLRTVELFRPPVWWLENPVGRIQQLNGLADPLLAMDPWHFGDPWTKRTHYWGHFNSSLPTAMVAPVQGSKVHKLSGRDKFRRSLTPEGVAYAMFMANNFHSMSVPERLARQFPGVEPERFAAALAAGCTERDLMARIEDSYHEQDLVTVRDILAQACQPAPGPGLPPAEPPVRQHAKLGSVSQFLKIRKALPKAQSQPLAPLTPEQLAEQARALMPTVRRFASGLTAISDLAPGARGCGSAKWRGVGVDVGLLSQNAIEVLGNAVIRWKAALFIDSGAFSAFRRGLKSGKFESLDFHAILSRYDAILDVIGRHAQDDGEQTDYPRPLLVMPDVVGSQSDSLDLIRRHRHWIATEVRGHLSQPIIPLQKGELSLAQAYQEVVQLMGSANFIVGVPSNEEAVTPLELQEFLADAQPQAIHILGAASPAKLQPRLMSVVAAGLAGKVRITVDASPIRNQVIRAVAKGAKRSAVIEQLQFDPTDPGLHPA